MPGGRKSLNSRLIFYWSHDIYSTSASNFKNFEGDQGNFEAFEGTLVVLHVNFVTYKYATQKMSFLETLIEFSFKVKSNCLKYISN